MQKSLPNIYIYSGDGLSAPSGVPTYRGGNNTWDENKSKVVNNINTFQKNRKKVFEFVKSLKKICDKAKPNSAHRSIASLQKKYGTRRVHVCTQNIDNMLERAGCTDVVHLHGSFLKLHCMDCDHTWQDKMSHRIKCPQCKSKEKVRPYVRMYGEDERRIPEYQIMKNIYGTQLKREDIFIVVGTSGCTVDMDVDLDYPTRSKEKNGGCHYWETNYFLNVFNDNHFNKTPDDYDNYFVESCETFFPKITQYIEDKMNIQSVNTQIKLLLLDIMTRLDSIEKKMGLKN